MKTEEQMIEFWNKLDEAKKSGDAEAIRQAKNSIASEYYGIVTDVAERMAPKLKEVTAEECASYGVDGLYEAIEKFDRSLNIQFKTFAPHRIRGAILDNIRKVDWVPRLVRQRNTSIERLRQNYFKEHGCNPSDSEMALMLQCSKDQFDILAKKSIPVGVVSIYNKPKEGHEDEFEDMLNVKDQSESDPILRMLREEMFKKLLGHDFTKLERKIVYLVYYENLTMKEVAGQTGFSESRISQMHGEIIRRLKQKVCRNPEYATELEKMLESN
jgi:RNA polymerase sigma factor FliA